MRFLRWHPGILRAIWRWSPGSGMWTGLAWLAAVALVVTGLWSIFGPVGEWAAGPTVAEISDREKRAAAINAVRQTLLAAAAGLAATAGLAFTARTFYLSRRGQLTDRYTKAITQLASDKLEERLGGIYALEHLMRESARDHQTVVDVLAAFVRERSQASAGTPPSDGPVSTETMPPTAAPGNHPPPRIDVQAALTVLGRRPPHRELHPLNLSRAVLRGADLFGADLRGTDLRGAQLQKALLNRALLQYADLRGAQLQKATLCGAQLQNANLYDAQLQGARLDNAELQNAYLSCAQLQGAHLYDAQLQSADLSYANLSGAQLQNARLEGADLSAAGLSSADLSGARLQKAHLESASGLVAAQLRVADFDGTTGLDESLRADLATAVPPPYPAPDPS